MTDFQLASDFKPTGDQPQAISELVEGISNNDAFQTLLGATGTGKTFTVANVIQQTQKPTLILAHNKTLAAQLYSEFRDFFPNNAVSYFVSYYDYYQPEAYVPRRDLFIEKETQINDEIGRLRLQTMANLTSRRDVIIVASVSCIYGIGSPEAWGKVMLEMERGKQYRRNTILRQLVDIQYDRNDMELSRGKFRVRGDTLQIFPAYMETAYSIEFWGDIVERIAEFDPLTGEVLVEHTKVAVYPAREFITDEDKLAAAINDIEAELNEQLAFFKQQNRLLEAQRIEQRTLYDLEMLREVGFTSGIENYSRHLDQRPPGSRPWTLLDYFPADYLMVIDESHMTVPQVRGMWRGDRSRKETLVDYGFRLPSALDNRPLDFNEFEGLLNQTIFTSATPGPFELEESTQVVRQVIRPTGVVDPVVEVRPVRGQVDDLIGEINKRTAIGQRVLVTTLTKRMAEDLSDYLLEMGIKVHYLHSEVHTLERTEILRDLRLGVFDVVVGINLLREGLDLPEVSLVAILDADKEGFLRSETSLTQTIGRAARHIDGRVIMYADKITNSMQRAMDTTNERRAVQIAYNEEHGIEPASIVKAIHALTDELAKQEMDKVLAEEKAGYVTAADLPPAELNNMINELERQMKQAAQSLEFEKAALLRDQIVEMRQVQVLKKGKSSPDASAWERLQALEGVGVESAYETE